MYCLLIHHVIHVHVIIPVGMTPEPGVGLCFYAWVNRTAPKLFQL